MAKLVKGLKVFRTKIGFDEYVVATSSKKAALEAWDVTRDLFAAGEAERTEDAKAIEVALSNPGKAVAMPRGGARKKAAKKKR
ncbi:MAG TPA: hypothetical protein VEA80_15595 [Vitreimonas sp.]|uniref:hypothetical protein n=1 Tax=Vitreimonas sp. TaxID=3069702 RepID=UPI002D5390D3|nr:hypothetical protein [Vitreimonas sp.]HYD88898.1 hypothetical protein [Vitreimonas sp.]